MVLGAAADLSMDTEASASIEIIPLWYLGWLVGVGMAEAPPGSSDFASGQRLDM